MLSGIVVGHYNLVIFLHVYLATTAHLLHLSCAPTCLFAHALVHLRLQDAELVEFSLSRHTKTAIAVGTSRKTSPEVWKLIDNR